jgi:acyl-[acyl-carrier-protein]-phospholipid O-acyltransferase/long-chain-fatty-acid--[acyl-carrier-protein] ligase
VNLNFTPGKEALRSSIARGEIKHAITAKLVEKKLEDFPWPPEILRIEEILPKMKKTILLWRIAVLLLPGWLLSRMLGIPRQGDREEAVLLFTSGSSGEPKGVVLSHRNILGNVSQFGMMLSLGKHDTILACLPFFHSFGCTVTLWYPLIEGVRTVTYPSPLDAAKNAELIEKHGVTLLLATPTFLRGYLRKAKPEQLKSLDLVITGAEKLPRDIAEAFEEKFGHVVLEGYGLTETAPVTSVNLPEPAAKEGQSVQPSSRKGSVGKLAPGMAAEIRDPETGAPLPLSETGMLWLRGPNIFEGYLHEPTKTEEVIVDGWFKTGDLARFDEDGFLYIEGRLSRFSKIAGEMVPHETVETHIISALDLPTEGDRLIAIVGVPDPAKGEALVLLAATELNQQDLRAKLNAAGVPNLWIPRTIVRVEKIPLLGSGKLDLKSCKDLAMQTAEA